MLRPAGCSLELNEVPLSQLITVIRAHDSAVGNTAPRGHPLLLELHVHSASHILLASDRGLNSIIRGVNDTSLHALHTICGRACNPMRLFFIIYSSSMPRTLRAFTIKSKMAILILAKAVIIHIIEPSRFLCLTQLDDPLHEAKSSITMRGSTHALHCRHPGTKVEQLD